MIEFSLMTEEEREAHLQRAKEFYLRCGEILGIETEYHVPYRKKTRWNARILGNGRYTDFGVIRRFSSTCITVMSLKGTKQFDSEEAVYSFLQEVTEKE